MSPRIVDKIIINDGALEAFRQIIKGYFKGIEVVMDGSNTLGQEIEANGWATEQEAKDFLSEQESDCLMIDSACHLFISQLRDFHSKQMSRNEAMRLWIDQMLAKQP